MSKYVYVVFQGNLILGAYRTLKEAAAALGTTPEEMTQTTRDKGFATRKWETGPHQSSYTISECWVPEGGE